MDNWWPERIDDSADAYLTLIDDSPLQDKRDSRSIETLTGSSPMIVG